MTTYTRRSDRHRRKSNKNPFLLVTLLLIILLVGGSGYVAYNRYQEYALQKKIDAKQATLLSQIDKEQTEDDFPTERKEQQEKHALSLVFIPKDEQNIPIKAPKEELTNLMKAEKKKLKHSRQAVLVGYVTHKNLTDDLCSYSVNVDVYDWKDSKEDFEKMDEQTTDLVYTVKETGEQVTGQDLITSEADYLGIQQVIQQKILDQAENPEAILDSVLDLPRIDSTTTMSYAPDHLKITLPENQTGVDDIDLNYDEIQPFIQTNLVDPNQFKESTQKLEENKKYIALTFDDGPSPKTTMKLLDILTEKNVPATFFILGQNAEAYPDIVKREHEEGHEVASHSYSHPQLNTLSADQIREEMKKADRSIFEATGVLPRNLRPPYGAIDTETARVVGKPIIQWNIDSYDWSSKNADAVIQRVNDTVEEGGIMLMHDIHPSTVKAIGRVIDNLRDQGYEFVTVSQLLEGQEKPLTQYFGQLDHREV